MVRGRQSRTEQFIARHATEPELTLDRFVAETGDVPVRDRRHIAAYLRATRLFASLAGSTPCADGASSPAASHLVGQRIGEFQLDRVIGRGGTGTVFAAHSTTGAAFAVKVLHPAFQADPVRAARFRHEAATLRRLRHPNIVSVIESGEAGGIAYLAMEHIDGDSLDELLATGALPAANDRRARQAAMIGVALADALHHAHGVGLVHRDVKPGNVLIHGSGHAYLLDFGFARDAMQSRLTGSDEVLGTPVYMAPEQREPGIGPVDVRTDVFGLGLTLFECATGRHPYPRGVVTPSERLTSAPRAPRALAAVLLKAIDPEPNRRYSTAAAFRDDLQRFLDGEPVEARPPGILMRARLAVRRHPVAIGFGLTALAVVAALATVVGERNRVIAASLADARALLADDRPTDARRALDRAREFGAEDDVELAASIDRALHREQAEAAFDEVPFIVADPEATAQDLERADRICEQVLTVRAGPDRFEPLLLRALVAFLRGQVLPAMQFGSAAAECRGVSVTPEVLTTIRRFGAGILKQSRGEDLLRQLLLGAQFAAPELEELIPQLERLRAEQGHLVPEVDPFFAMMLGAAGHPERALELLDLAIERDPGRPNRLAVLFKVLCLNRRGEPRLALEVARNAIMTSPRPSAGLHALRARLYWQLADPLRTLADCDQALRLQPTLRGALLLAAESLLALDRPREALARCERVLADDVDQIQASCFAARAHAMLGATGEAMRAGRRALRLMERQHFVGAEQRRDMLLDLMLWASAPAPAVGQDRKRALADEIARCPPLLRCDEEDVRARLQLASLELAGGGSDRATAILTETADAIGAIAAEPPARADPARLRAQLRSSTGWAAAELRGAARFAALRARSEFASVDAAWRNAEAAVGKRSLLDRLRGR